MPDPRLPLSQRLLFGGLGGVAPLVVTGIKADFATVFGTFTLVAAAGYGVKALLMLFAGAAVCSMNKRETDPWKCFVMGISAPALIATTAAKADELPLSSFQPPTAVSIVSPSYFQETFLQQFQRGFSNYSPEFTINVVSKERDPELAKRDAAAAWLFAQCSTTRQTLPPADPSLFGGPSSVSVTPLVIANTGTDASLNPFLAILQTSGPPNQMTAMSSYLASQKVVQQAVRSQQYTAAMALSNLLQDPSFLPLTDSHIDALHSSISPNCRPAIPTISGP